MRILVASIIQKDGPLSGQPFDWSSMHIQQRLKGRCKDRVLGFDVAYIRTCSVATSSCSHVQYSGNMNPKTKNARFCDVSVVNDHVYETTPANVRTSNIPPALLVLVRQLGAFQPRYP